MRFSLADAGDSLEDANFDTVTAEAQLLRLYAMIEWTKEVLSIKPTKANDRSSLIASSDENTNIVTSLIQQTTETLDLSENSNYNYEVLSSDEHINYHMNIEYNYIDRMFESAINNAIVLSQENYDKMLYRNVLKYGFFDLQAARDNYRELCSESEEMNLHLIKRFIEVQTLLLAPICPHICEYIYQFLYPGKTIMNAKWPIAGRSTIMSSFIRFFYSKQKFRLSFSIGIEMRRKRRNR